MRHIANHFWMASSYVCPFVCLPILKTARPNFRKFPVPVTSEALTTTQQVICTFGFKDDAMLSHIL